MLTGAPGAFLLDEVGNGVMDLCSKHSVKPNIHNTIWSHAIYKSQHVICITKSQHVICITKSHSHMSHTTFRTE